MVKKKKSWLGSRKSEGVKEGRGEDTDSDPEKSLMEKVVGKPVRRVVIDESEEEMAVDDPEEMVDFRVRLEDESEVIDEGTLTWLKKIDRICEDWNVKEAEEIASPEVLSYIIVRSRCKEQGVNAHNEYTQISRQGIRIPYGGYRSQRETWWYPQLNKAIGYGIENEFRSSTDFHEKFAAVKDRYITAERLDEELVRWHIEKEAYETIQARCGFLEHEVFEQGIQTGTITIRQLLKPMNKMEIEKRLLEIRKGTKTIDEEWECNVNPWVENVSDKANMPSTSQNIYIDTNMSVESSDEGERGIAKELSPTISMVTEASVITTGTDGVTKRRKKGKVSAATRTRQQKKRNQLKNQILTPSFHPPAVDQSSTSRKRPSDNTVADIQSLVLQTPRTSKRRSIQETGMEDQSIPDFCSPNFVITPPPNERNYNCHIANITDIGRGMEAEFARNMRTDEWFEDNYIYAFLCILAKRSNKNIAVVSPVYSNLDAQAQVHMNAADNCFINNPDINIILMPVHFGNHWTLLIHEKNGRTLFIDSIPSEQFENRLYDSHYPGRDERRLPLLVNGIRSIIPVTLEQDIIIEIVSRFDKTNQTDGVSCGLFLCLYAESYLENNTFILPYLDIVRERRRILWHIRQLFDTDDVQYIPRTQIEADVVLPPDNIQQKVKTGAPERLVVNKKADKLTSIRTPAIEDSKRRVKIRDKDYQRKSRSSRIDNSDCDGRKHFGWGCGSLVARENGCPLIDLGLFDVGTFTTRCPHDICDALHLPGESSQMCCMDGKLKIKVQKDAPEPLNRLKGPDNLEHPGAKKFKENATIYNTMLQFASVTYHQKDSVVRRQPPVCKVNGKITHQLGPLIPGANRPPAFQGLYVRDPEEAEEYRKNILENSNISGNDCYRRVNFELLRQLDAMMRQHNPIVKDLKTAHKYYEDIVQQARTANEKIPELEMRILSRREVPNSVLNPSIHPHQMNITHDPLEVSALWIAGENEPPNVEGTRIVMHGGGLKKLKYFDSNVPALCYPLVHPHGEVYYKHGTDSYEGGANMEEEEEGLFVDEMPGTIDRAELFNKKGCIKKVQKRRYASQRQKLRAFLFIRPRSKQHEANPRSPHPLWGMRKLAQKWLLDQVWTIEAKEADYLKKKVQQHYRTELPAKLIDGIKRGLKPHQQLGSVFKVPRTMKGSPAYMQEAYAKAMSIFRRMGKPTFMVTFTGNPGWEEIVDGMFDDGQIPADRPDVICRVFEEKVKEIRKDLEVRGVLGDCIGHVERREFQDKGCPHFHKLMTIDEKTLPEGMFLNSPELVDQYISAEIPPYPTDEDWNTRPEWARSQKRYRELVEKSMLHTCTSDSICRQNGRCSKRYPKEFSDETIVPENSPVIYRRRNNGITVKKKTGSTWREFDNRYVVPHNRFLLEKYGCHINVEKAWGLGAGKYALKYITKGREIAYVVISRTENGQEIVDFDEFDQIFETNHMTAQEAYTRLISVPIVRLSHTVYRMAVHKPEGASIVFREGKEVEAAQRAWNQNKNSKFVGYMRLCEKDKEAREMTFEQLPEKYVWHKDMKDTNNRKGVWKKEKKQRHGVIGNIFNVFPSDPELFSIRLLAIHRKGYTSFDELKNVNGVDHEKFVEAARAMGLVDDIELWRATLDEVCKHMTKRWQIIRFFAQLLLFSCQLHARPLYDEFLEYMLGHPQSENVRNDRTQKLLRYLARTFGEANRSCEDFGLPLPDHYNIEDDINEFYFGDEDEDISREQLPKDERMYQILNEEQKDVVDTIENTCEQIRQNPGDKNIQRLFYLNGSGGHGKSFTTETLIRRAKSSRHGTRRHILSTASTGIAAAVLPGATTLHSAFRLPLNRRQTQPNIRWQDLHGARIRAAETLIIDEVSMVETRLMDMVDKTCRDLEPNPQKKKLPFGGKVVMIVGDWKQLLPVLPGKSIQEQAGASFRSSEMYQHFHEFKLTQNMRMTAGQEAYKKFIGDIGSGKNFLIHNGMETDRVEIPENISTVYSKWDLLRAVFPPDICQLATSNNLEEKAKFAQNVILSTTNNMVNSLNETILDRIDGDSREYLSIDQAIIDDPLDTVYDADKQPENLNQINTGSLPLHKLRLKKGAVAMLLRNLSVRDGLCNGTRFIVESMGEHVIWCRRLNSSGQLEEEIYPIARFEFNYDDSADDKTGLRFKRVQFPLKLASALTINKSQGQTICGKIGIDLSKDVFSPGMLYVAMSRTTDAQNVTILTQTPSEGQRPSMKNIVWDFDHPGRFLRPQRPPVEIPVVEVTDDEDNENVAFDFNMNMDAFDFEAMNEEVQLDAIGYNNAVNNNDEIAIDAVNNNDESGMDVVNNIDEIGIDAVNNIDEIGIDDVNNIDEIGSDAEANEMDLEERLNENKAIEEFRRVEYVENLDADELNCLENYLNDLSEDSENENSSEDESL